VIANARRRVVQAGYDELSPRFGEWGERIEGDPWRRFVDELSGRLDEGARALDLGCGNGVKTKVLAERFDVVGVDLSEKQLQLARAEVPSATFVQADFADVDFPAESFDAVTALYSFVHVPRAEHPSLFARVLGWLKPAGLFLASLSSGGSEDWSGEWLGVEMFFSGHDAGMNRRLLREAGFELLLDEAVTMREPEGEAAFLWVLGRKPQ
jgi:cyclopropane fatty-acyl-phospholipid synthase-like methyltransferase